MRFHKSLNDTMYDETPILHIHEHLQLHASQYKQKTQHPSHPLHRHTTYFITPRLSLTTAATQQTFPQYPHNPYNRHKTNMRHIHGSIVSRHLAIRGNNKILRAPPHISSTEEILLRLPRCTLAQLRTNKSPFLKSYLHKSTPNHIHHHYVTSVTLTHTTHTISLTAPTYAPHCHPWICGQTPSG